MAEAVYQHRKSQVKSCAIVGGKGQEAARDIEVRASAGDGATFHREAFVNATQYDVGDTSGLQDRGDQYLDENADKEELKFKILDVENARYGVDYCVEGVLGDLVSILRPHDGTKETHKIEGVTVSVGEDGEESITVETVKQ